MSKEISVLEFLGEKPADVRVQIVKSLGSIENNRGAFKINLLDADDKVVGQGKVGCWQIGADKAKGLDEMKVDSDGIVTNFVLSRKGKYLLNPQSFGKGMDDAEFGVELD